ncbi:MAG: response regulator transcription factor [Pseudomonadota bacterium]
MIRIIVADDHSIVREGLKFFLSSVDGMMVVGEAANGDEVIRRVRELDVDVLILDLSMPGRDGIELIKLVCGEKNGLGILVLSMHKELQYAMRALRNGASGYLTKDDAMPHLEQAIRKVAAGGAFIGAEVAEQLALDRLHRSPFAPHETLSDREFAVLRLLLDGSSNVDIGKTLHLSAKTVSTHKANLMRKMSLQNDVELIRYALNHGLSEPLKT